MMAVRTASPRLPGSLILLIFLIGACSFSPDGGIGAADPNLTPTPTPFQPQDGFSPSASVLTRPSSQTLDANGIPLEEGILITPASDAPLIPLLNLSPDINPLTGSMMLVEATSAPSASVSVTSMCGRVWNGVISGLTRTR